MYSCTRIIAIQCCNCTELIRFSEGPILQPHEFHPSCVSHSFSPAQLCSLWILQVCCSCWIHGSGMVILLVWFPGLYCLTLCSLISIVGVMIMQEIGWQRHFVSLVCGSEFSFLKCLSMATWDCLISSLTFWCTFPPNLRLFQHHVGLSRWALKNSIFFCSSDEFSRGMKELLTSSCNL